MRSMNTNERSMNANERAHLLERCLRLEAQIAQLEEQLHIRDRATEFAQAQAQAQLQLREQHLRQCTDCDQIKPLEAFCVDASKPSGYRGRCKACQRIVNRQRPRERQRTNHAAKQRAWHAKNPGKRREYQQRWEQRHPEQAKELRRKRNQKRRKREQVVL